MIRITIVSVFLLSLNFNLTAQEKNTNNYSQEAFESLWRAGGDALVTKEAYGGVRGTPFMLDYWSKGLVSLKAGSQFTELDMKYDMVMDNVRLRDKSAKEIYPAKTTIMHFSLIENNGNVHTFINIINSDFTYDPEFELGFYELLYNGKNKFLVKRRKYLKHIEARGGYSENKSYDEFHDHPLTYYWVNEEGVITEIKKGQRNVLKGLNDNGQLKELSKNQGLNLRKEEDILQLIRYLDILQQKSQ